MPDHEPLSPENARKIEEIGGMVEESIGDELRTGRSIQIIFVVNIACGGIGSVERQRKDRFNL
jgi:hypothetical protein